MTDWVCHRCGTMNNDMFASASNFNELQNKRIEKLMEKRLAVERMGGVYKEYCSRCKCQRL